MWRQEGLSVLFSELLEPGVWQKLGVGGGFICQVVKVF
jgi:hypothetical protein